MRRLRALVGLAGNQLRYHRRRGALAVVGVALAVLLVTLLVGLGFGLFTTGGEAISWINRDLWVTGGGLGIQAGGVGGVENPIQNAHGVAADIESDPRVAAAQPIAFMTVYVSPNRSEFDSVVGVGAVGEQDPDVGDGDGLTLNDSHYANGTYEGPRSREVIVSPELAERYGVGVNDTLYVGGTLASARENPFRVVAVTARFSTFLGSNAVAVPLSELQAVTGTTGTDRAALIGVSLDPGANADAVERDIERSNPELTVRGNDEQVRQIVGGQAAVVVGVVALVVLAVVSGMVLVVNVLATLVRVQRDQLAALNATGVSTRSLVVVVLAQGLLVGLLGGVAGAAVTVPAVDALNRVLADLSGFPNLVKTPWWVYASGVTLATLMGVIGSTVAGRQVATLSPLDHLRSP
ncbi:ABC transporter permease [Halorarius halobius]|uniref:ABC transporter permease n=1 Tax=Halorarius halobius TaxID=2962671 RepID=UPI0020CDBAB4|nr:ABC transporter permease [Halorarius halobius]